MIYAKVIEDSTCNHGKRITTLELQYQRFIHGEFLTHRVFSRNSMSSRAIPVEKMIEQVRSNPAMPVYWGANRPGMQAKQELDVFALHAAKAAWEKAAREAADTAEHMERTGLHKQIANRILEPFQWMRTIVTATEWDNFFALREHPDAQPEFQALANAIHLAMNESTPVNRWFQGRSAQTSSWHLPYISSGEREYYVPSLLPKLSAARCARVSYLTHDGNTPSIDKDIELYDRLITSTPMHASPVEHQAYPAETSSAPSGNFVGWVQYRQTIGKAV